MIDILITVLGRLLLRVLLQYLDNLATTVTPLILLSRDQWKSWLSNLSWPIDSPEPSDFDHPDS